MLSGHGDALASALFSPDGTQILTGSIDRTARLWPTSGGPPRIFAGHDLAVITAVFSPDGSRIVTGSFDRTVRVWNLDGRGEPRILDGHGATAAAGSRAGGGAFSPDGAWIVTYSDDKTIRWWPVDDAGDIAAPVIIKAPGLDAWSASFTPDGSRLVTSSHMRRHAITGEIEHVAKVWPTPRPLSGPDDPRLWRATRYCPPIAIRVAILGVSEDMAARDLDACRRRVRATHGAKDVGTDVGTRVP